MKARTTATLAKMKVTSTREAATITVRVGKLTKAVEDGRPGPNQMDGDTSAAEQSHDEGGEAERFTPIRDFLCRLGKGSSNLKRGHVVAWNNVEGMGTQVCVEYRVKHTRAGRVGA